MFFVKFERNNDESNHIKEITKAKNVEYCMQQNRGVGRGNLRKTIKLLAKSNASLLGWMYLSVMYYENEVFMNQFYALRTALAGKGIIERNTFPSVDFMELLPIVLQII